MTTVQINCENPWQDYTGGADHRTTEEARACETEHRASGDERTHVVIVPLEEYERLLTEVSRLSRWQSEAEAVIEEWDHLWEMAGCPGELGKTKAAGLLSALQSDGVI